jgi:DNA helicase IV
MRLPTLDELIGNQRTVYDHPLNQSLFAVGPPGSGKTTLALHRAKRLVEAGQSVVLITYNRMLRRLVELLNTSQASVKTMQSFVWNDYLGRTGEEPPRSPFDRHAYIWTAMLQKLVGHPSAGRKIDHVIVDEGQDLPFEFYQYAVRHIAPVISVFADENQAVRSHATTPEEIRNATGLLDPVLLHENRRNTPEIATLAEHFHRGRVPPATVCRSSIQDVPRLFCSKSSMDVAQRIATWFQNRSGAIGVVVDQNDVGVAIHAELRRLLPGRRVDMYSSNTRNEDSIDLLNAGVTVMNMKSAKGQEFDTLFIVELEAFVPCRDEAMRRVMYMLCARARDHLWLVHGPGNLSAAAEASLPNHLLLQRIE